jgi:hypothetical protein
MSRPHPATRFSTRRPPGVALVVAVLVLVVLSSLLAGLAVRITMVKRRQAYIVEYQRARYALDSALKYAMVVMPNQTYRLQSRADVPDFSDLFVMNAEQYRSFLQAWAMNATDEQLGKVLNENGWRKAAETPMFGSPETLDWLSGMLGMLSGDPNEMPAAEIPTSETEPNSGLTAIEIDPNDFDVPGPYGAPWPYVVKPIELQIGSAKVTITVEDENAKMPLSWAVTSRETVNKKAEAALTIFCDWMGMTKTQRMDLLVQLDDVYKQKAFELNPSPIMLPPQARAPAAGQTQPAGRITTTRTTTTTAARQRQAQQQALAAQSQAQQRPAVAHATDFAKLFHSSLLDREPLARPVGHTALPNESPLKYLALWGSQRINVNTAPRHVLEAALSFGADDPADLAEKIIRQRQAEPIKTIGDLKKTLYSDSMAIDRAKDYLTTTSNFFLVRVTSHSGNARVSAAVTVIKEGRNVERLAILYGL